MAAYKTPTLLKFRSALKDEKTIIPESPMMTHLGHGTGVSVYRMKRSPKVGEYQSPWAVKRVLRRPSIEVKCYAERLKDEADILKKLNHPNIVGFRAFVQTEDGRDCLAMEECDSSIGDMVEQRVENGVGPFSPDNILKVALDIAKALDYLHTECRLLHGDIKSFNILVKGDFEVMKLCDFGVSVPLNEEDKVTAGYTGTDCWSAPEALIDDGIVTSKADIFSFGLVLWEMMTLKVPHLEDSVYFEGSSESNTSTPTHKFSNNDSIVELSETSSDFSSTFGTRPAVPDSVGQQYELVIQLFNMCTEQDPHDRPSAKQIIEFLKSKKKAE